MSYLAKRELEALPAEIESLEREQSELNNRMNAPEYYRESSDQMKRDRKRAEELELLLNQKFERWDALEKERIGYEA
jgi:ATP-binding cassette subfamily F protein uup